MDRIAIPPTWSILHKAPWNPIEYLEFQLLKPYWYKHPAKENQEQIGDLFQAVLSILEINNYKSKCSSSCSLWHVKTHKHRNQYSYCNKTNTWSPLLPSPFLSQILFFFQRNHRESITESICCSIYHFHWRNFILPHTNSISKSLVLRI